MGLSESILMPLTIVSATYLICFSLQGDFKLLYVARGGELQLTFFKEKMNVYKQIFQTVKRTLYSGRRKPN